MDSGVRDKARRLATHLLATQRYAVLSTASDKGPYCSLIAFWAPEDLTYVVFATMRTTRKFGFLVEHPQVALLFDDRSNREADVRQSMAVTVLGAAREVTEGTERRAAAAAFVSKHPQLTSFVQSPGCALVRVDTDICYVVSEFENVVELDAQTLRGDGTSEAS